MKQSITIVDIAKEAGVSISTVSRVLTGSAKVNPEKAAKINAIIKKYDFHPNVLARGLIQTKTSTIGILTADIRNPYYSTLFLSCEQAAEEQGYNLMLCNSFSDRLREFVLIDKLTHQKVDAIILIGGATDDAVTDQEYAEKIRAITKNIPVLIIGHMDGLPCPVINIDYKKEIELIKNFIAEHKSFKRIAFAGGSTKVRQARTLREYYRKMLEELNLEYIPELDIPNDRYDEEGGYIVMDHMLSESEKPDLVIAANDIFASGAMKAIREHNLRIPEDISILSFDDTYISNLMEPPLTTIGYNFWHFGQTIISTAIKMIEKEEVPEETLITPKLIIRRSCKEQ